MFEEKKEITEAVGRLIEYTKRFSKGDIVSVADAELVVACSYAEQRNRFVHIARRWIRWMSKHRRVEVVWVKGEGFRLCTDEDCATWVPASRRAKAFRQHGRAIRSYKSIDHAKVPPNLALIAAAGIEFSKRQRSELRKIKKALSEEGCARAPRVSFAPDANKGGAS